MERKLTNRQQANLTTNNKEIRNTTKQVYQMLYKNRHEIENNYKPGSPTYEKGNQESTKDQRKSFSIYSEIFSF